jgi:phage tail sheath protein FI
MAINPTAPGVYIQEISTLPPSVAPVATAIPAFIGYTEKGPSNKATRITSMLDFETVFGGAFNEAIKVTLTTNMDDETEIAVAPVTSYSDFVLYQHMQMYFANGGGPCYIISVGNYSAVPALTDFFDIGTGKGVEAAEKVDEITLLVAPESIYLGDADRLAINDAMLAQCNKLQDRFAIMDVEVTSGGAISDSDDFRNDNVGNNFLKYGAAYYPSLQTVLTRSYKETEVVIDDNRTSPVFTASPFDNLASVYYGKGEYTQVVVANPPTAPLANSVTINGIALSAGIHFAVDTASAANTANNLIAAIEAHPILSGIVYAGKASDFSTTFKVNIFSIEGALATISAAGDFSPSSPTITPAPLVSGLDRLLHAAITAELRKLTLVLYPSATMAGIYAAVDRTRGVWKAPANTSLSLVKEPTVILNEDENGDMNIHGTGKSVNAIRKFVGKGTIVWGARTLAGNDNEWRYVNVRRYFNYAEESIKKATESVVFEPNDANTWLRVKGTITNFLTNEWRNGALVGAKPEHAFFVKVGLNETMTAQDILEGKLIIQIGLAVSRPAEFIILQFMHKLQES